MTTPRRRRVRSSRFAYPLLYLLLFSVGLALLATVAEGSALSAMTQLDLATTTLVPSTTPIPTATPIPTQTSEATASSILPSLTQTPIPTPVPSATPTPVPTLTPVPPTVIATATPPPAPPTAPPAPTALLPTPTVPLPTPTALPVWDGVERTLKVPILMYHYVSVPPPGSNDYRHDLSVGPDVFRAQLITLREQGYTSITLSQLLYALQQGTPLPEKPVVLTFDDGYRDNYDHAFPIMKQEGFVGTFFVVTELVEQRNAGYMTWEQIVEMKESGMEIGSHTRDHPILTGSSIERIWRELVESRAILQERLGQEINGFAYPFGRFDDGVVHLTHLAGYSVAVTTKQGVTHTTGNVMSLRRIRVHGSVFPPALMEIIHHWMYEATEEPR
ncbi:MAG: polysaccharide deacetylase family protein [Ardenticatenaceae bacterium]